MDPIDGTRLTANGMPDAISVLAVSARGAMYDPSAVFYMSKLVTGPEAADVVDIDAPAAAPTWPRSPGPSTARRTTSR